MRRKDVLSSPRLSQLKRRRRRVVQNKILLVAFALAVLFAALVFFARIDRLNITEVRITGNKVIDTELIREVAVKNINGHYLWFLPKSNFILFPKNAIKGELGGTFKRLKDISLQFENPKTLSISVAEREGKYLWCGAQLLSPDSMPEENVCYFLDESGFVFDEAPYFSGDVYFRFFGSIEGQYFSPGIFEKLIVLKESLENLGIKPTSLFVRPDEDVEAYLSSSRIPPDAPKIIFKKDFDVEKLSENLQAALDTDPLKSDIKNKYSSLKYIDLRFGNKVYFKF